MNNPLTKSVVWLNDYTFQLSDERTGRIFRIVVPYADEPDFYSPDEMEDIVGHAIERFKRDCLERPTHEDMVKSDQRALGKVLGEIKQARTKRKELGGPIYHDGLSASGLRYK